MKQNIIFIPTYYYLSNPLFFSITEKISKYEKIYLNTKELWKYNKGKIDRDEILKYFDKYYEIGQIFNQKYNKLSKLKKFIEMKKFIKNFKNILCELKPVAIITTSDMTFSWKICNQWARKNNVPVIIIQPSFFDFKKNNHNFKRRIKYLVFNKILDIPIFGRQDYIGNEDKNNYLFLWSEYFKQYYKNKSVYDNIYITGNPTLDKYLTAYEKKNDTYYKILNISPNKKIVVFCTQDIDKMYGIDDFTVMIKLLKEIIADNKEVYFVIKVHPREEIEKYNRALKEIDKKNCKIVKNVDLYKLYEITDVQISFASSYSSFEAIVLGIPIILINPKNKYEFIDYFNNEIELRASTSIELSSQIRKCLTEKYMSEFKFKRSKYLKSRLTYLDGKCGERVVNKLEEIMQNYLNIKQ